eukprot:1471-Eustigmatos_ZCMA.PRE.1
MGHLKTPDVSQHHTCQRGYATLNRSAQVRDRRRSAPDMWVAIGSHAARRRLLQCLFDRSQ